MIDIFTIETAFTALARAKRDAENDSVLFAEILAETGDAEIKTRIRECERKVKHYKKGVDKLILLAYRKGLDRTAINDLKAKLTSKWDLLDAGEKAGTIGVSGEMETGERSVAVTASLAKASQFAKRTPAQIEAEFRAQAERLGVLKKRHYRVLDVLESLGDARQTRDLNTAEIAAIKKIWAISESKMTNNAWYAKHRKKG